MWVFSKSRGEHDNRFMMNLDLCSRISLTALGEKWFIEVMHESETIPIAQLASSSEASKILQQIFDTLVAGTKALDLDNPPETRTDDGQQKQSPRDPGM